MTSPAPTPEALLREATAIAGDAAGGSLRVSYDRLATCLTALVTLVEQQTADTRLLDRAETFLRGEAINPTYFVEGGDKYRASDRIRHVDVRCIHDDLGGKERERIAHCTGEQMAPTFRLALAALFARAEGTVCAHLFLGEGKCKHCGITAAQCDHNHFMNQGRTECYYCREPIAGANAG